MRKSEKYLKALNYAKDWVTINEWANLVDQHFPELVTEAHDQAQEYKIPSNGLREIAARISSELTRTNFRKYVFIDDTVSPKKVKKRHDTQLLDCASLNQILYGPPGTGKTYKTIEASVLACEPGFPIADRSKLKARYDELVAENRIRFVTFHQSFSYEEFVEGLKARSEKGQINYQVEDGIFKQLCHYDETPVIESSTDESLSVEGRTVWKMSLGNTQNGNDDLFDFCINNNQIRLGYGEGLDYLACDSKQGVMAKLEANGNPSKSGDYRVTSVNTFKNMIVKGDLVVVTDGNLKFRAIAEVAGGYFHDEGFEWPFVQTLPVIWHRVYEKSLSYERVMRKKFSQMTLYHLSKSVLDMDKLQSLLLNEKDSSEIQQNIVKESTDSAARVLIIDEINRGNISKIFGDLITLIEPSKRAGASEALSVQLPYSKEPFSVPSNLHIIGTMNTADRSLAMMDTALRRRFDFVEMMPDYAELDGVMVNDKERELDLGKLLKCMNHRIEFLYDREHVLGHAFFMPIVEALPEQRFALLQSVFRNKIIPLLEEYFYEDWSKIRLILGDNQKKKPAIEFISEMTEGSNAEALFGSEYADEFDNDEMVSYQINTAAFEHIESYQGILGSNN